MTYLLDRKKFTGTVFCPENVPRFGKIFSARSIFFVFFELCSAVALLGNHSLKNTRYAIENRAVEYRPALLSDLCAPRTPVLSVFIFSPLTGC